MEMYFSFIISLFTQSMALGDKFLMAMQKQIALKPKNKIMDTKQIIELK